MSGGSPLPEEAYAAALASLPGIGPRRLRRLLDGALPSEVWREAELGRADDPDRVLMRAAAHVDVPGVWEAYRRAGIGVLLHGARDYPAVLAPDPRGPAVLFCLGDPTVVDAQPIVAIVGTRSATRYGLGVAAQLGADLATTGIAVASGLALGVDGAAHEGAYAGWRVGAPGSGPPVAVVANGLDTPYPRRHTRLWDRVAEAGVVLSESPIGVGAEKWRFSQRNRLLAAMADVVVVVECHAQGGSLSTANAAFERGTPVGAVPGSIRSPASEGTNALLADGCFPVRDVTDVLVAIGLVRSGRPSAPRAVAGGSSARPLPQSPGASVAAALAEAPGGQDDRPRSEPASMEGSVLHALGWEPCSVEQLLRRTGSSLGELSEALERLSAQGRVLGESGWWQRVECPGEASERP